ncbi:hypothetical protein HWV62_13469 [Athelia sp. TMB]|nr:hypothetical protein HWV62_13469 [Athelia sp. TMB]
MPFFQGAHNVDARGSTFNEIKGNQTQPEARSRRSVEPRGASEIHSAVLPNLGVTLGQGLSRFEPGISPWKYPQDWNKANAAHVTAIVQNFKIMTGNDEIEKAHLKLTYPRLTIYIFAHLITCAPHGKSDFENALCDWKDWDNLMAVQNHEKTKSYLRQMFEYYLINLDPINHTEKKFRQILALDAVCLTAQLTALVAVDAQYKKLVTCKGEPAQAFLNLLQSRLDYYIDPLYKIRHLKALIKLSELSKMFPECLTLKDVKLAPIPIASGSFGEVYQGKMANREIAVKVIKVYKKSDMDQIHKVNILVSDAGRACLADFGLSVAKDSRPVEMTMMTTGGTGGSLNWSAPELLPDMNDFTTKGSETAKPEAPCDVYAFAMMFSGCIPFAGKAEHHVIIAVSQGKRPERPMQSIARDRGLTDQIWEIIVTCWNQNPDKRLTAAEVVQRLRTLPNLPPDNRPADSFSMPPPSSATTNFSDAATV